MLKVIFIIATAALITQCTEVGPSAKTVQKNKEDPKIIVEPDQTDIYAIPLDEDAQDQQEELQELEHPKNGKKK